MPRPVRSPLHIRYLGSWIALGVLRLLSLVPLPILSHLGTGLGDVLRIVQRAIAVDPADRYASAARMRAAVGALLREIEGAERPGEA